MKGEDIFPSLYLKAADLKSRPALVAISHCAMEKLGDDQKLVIYFQGKDKGLVCNKTNFGRIAYLYGDETDDWNGAKIILAAELVDFQGKPMMAIRVRAPNGAGPKKPPLQNTENPAAPIEAAKRQPTSKEQMGEPEIDPNEGAYDTDIPF